MSREWKAAPVVGRIPPNLVRTSPCTGRITSRTYQRGVSDHNKLSDAAYRCFWVRLDRHLARDCDCCFPCKAACCSTLAPFSLPRESASDVTAKPLALRCARVRRRTEPWSASFWCRPRQRRDGYVVAVCPMSFKRFPLRTYGGDRESPSLEVELVGVNGRVDRRLALIDPGTDWTMMPLSLAQELGVDLSYCREIPRQGQGWLVNGGWHWSDSPEGQANDQPVVRVMGHEVPLAPMVADTVPIVALGREDFLTSFKFCLDQRDKSFSLEPYDEPVEQWLKRTGHR